MRRTLLAILCVFHVSVFGGSNPKKAVAIRTPTAPTINGRLDEPVWKLAQPIVDFVQFEPIEGAAPGQKTEVRILYDNEALYFGCRMYDTDPSKIVGRLVRRDDEIDADVISLRIDSYHDHQTNFEFTINAAGVKIDILQYDDGRKEDPSWDVVWDVETTIDDQGWIAEIKIPFSVLRYSRSEVQDWGLQIVRGISRTHESIYWTMIGKKESGWTSKFSHLVGIDKLPSTSHVELMPYAVGGSRFMPKSLSHPDGTDRSLNAGLDLKVRPSGGITIDATFNPDFGQVEADPAVLNLTTYETFYPEKRPFFIEGSQIIHFSTFGDDFGPGLFYSRRIGRSIEVEDPDGGYVLHEPQFASILGAVKLSGKTEDGWSIGILEALTQRETATLVDALGNKTDQVVEPLTNYGVLRLKKDFWGNSNAGMILTSVNRDGRVPANTAGLDWNLKFNDNMYRVDGFLAGSRTTTLSGDRLDGSAGKLSFNKEGGEHWRYSTSIDFTSKKYNINDIGYFRRPNDFGSNGQLEYRNDVPGDHVRSWSVSAGYHYRNTFSNAELNKSVGLEAGILFLNYWELWLEGDIDRGKYDDRESRGHGLYRKPGSQKFGLSVETDSRQSIVLDVMAGFERDERAGRAFEIGAEIELRPVSNIALEFNLGYQERENVFAWMTNVIPIWSSSMNFTNAVFAERTTQEWDLTSRGSVVFLRDLTLQYYVQIFFAKGKYEHPEIMAGEDRFLPYPFVPVEQFNELAFNSNLVLRWEYLPGSTLYLVWSQARNGSRGLFETPLSENFSNTFSLPSTNALLLKISYWFSY
ncbi:MAG: DUF5916 domain-containing protein [bacterium]